MATHSPTINVMIRAAETAARSLLRDFGEVEQLQVSRKGPGDFVSAADHRSEEIIHRELSKARPDYGFLMEERGEIKGDDAENRWIVDPLDGTTNFLHGIPHWCITIALEQKGEVVAGLIYDAVRDEMFTAEKGGGAFMQRKRLRVSSRNNLMDSVLSCGLPGIHHKGTSETYIRQTTALIPQVAAIRRLGAAALDLAYVAAGRLEGYWEYNLKPWDLAAGTLILKEAGGFSSTLDGQGDAVYGKSIVAANGGIFNELRRILHEAEKNKNAA